jgi:hypothetical protein
VDAAVAAEAVAAGGVDLASAGSWLPHNMRSAKCSSLQQGCQHHGGLGLLHSWVGVMQRVWHLFRKHPARAAVPHGQG